MKNQKIVEHKCRLRYRKLLETAEVGEIIDFKYGSLRDDISLIVKEFASSRSEPTSKTDYYSDELSLREWFNKNIEFLERKYNEFWLITSGDIAWVNIRLSNPSDDLFSLWVASGKNFSCVTGDYEYCFDFSTYENDYEFHKQEI